VAPGAAWLQNGLADQRDLPLAGHRASRERSAPTDAEADCDIACRPWLAV
jgi:hypothetical protein